MAMLMTDQLLLPTGGPALAAPVVVDALGFRVDPSVRQRFGDGVLPRQATILDVSPVQAHPQLIRGVVVRLEP